MTREPWFWRSDTPAARAVAAGLTPLSAIYDLAQRARWRMTAPAAAPLPVICVGNATLGGVGKTPCAIAVRKLLAAEGVECCFLTRGYGGAERGPLRVDLERHSAIDVGDEALLLARHAPTWISRDRRAGADKAAEAGAGAIIMDDGFQNPAITKTFSILLIDPESAANSHVFPAGPFREPLARAEERADAIVYVGANRGTAEGAAAAHQTPFAAWLAPASAPAAQRVVAFCGIGKPARFFALLKGSGFEPVRTLGYPDHHDFTDHDLRALRKLSETEKAPLITTEKDHVRLPASFAEAVMTFPVEMKFNQPALLAGVILSAMSPRKPID